MKINRKTDNKGFTLVELIVVLVILSILAAILIPALLGYIDKAHEKQYVLHAKSAYTAAQSVTSELYAKGADPVALYKGSKEPVSVASQIEAIADLDELGCTGLLIGFSDGYVQGVPLNQQHSAYTVSYVAYTEAGVTIELMDGEWVITSDGKPSVAAGNTSGAKVFTVR